MHTQGAEVTTVKMGFWKRLLDTLIDPNLIALMLSLGVLGIVIELWHRDVEAAGLRIPRGLLNASRDLVREREGRIIFEEGDPP